MKIVGKGKVENLVKDGAFLVDMRNPVAFRDGHVAGAVNLPLRNFVNKIMAMDKKTTIVIYGESVEDADLRQGDTYARALGFSNIFISDYTRLTTEHKFTVQNVPRVTRERMDKVKRAARNNSRKHYPKP